MFHELFEFLILFQIRFGCNFLTIFTISIFWIICIFKFLNLFYPVLKKFFYKIYLWTNLLILNLILNIILLFLNILKIFDVSIQLLLIYNLVKCIKEILDKVLLYIHSIKKIGKKRKLSDEETRLHLDGKSALILTELINERNNRQVTEGYFLFSRNNDKV
jgi:hypothetical protein